MAAAETLLNTKNYKEVATNEEIESRKFQTTIVGEITVPYDVPDNKVSEYIENYRAATQGTGRLMLFAADQKIEHLNDDFYGEGIDPADNDPKHMFRIAEGGTIGVMAAQKGLIARYAPDYPDINYLVKMNSKTNLDDKYGKTLKRKAEEKNIDVDESQLRDPDSPQLYSLESVLDMKKAGANVVGVGYTIYLGSEYEAEMMKEAGQLISDAHKEGLIVVLWIYPRGKAVSDEKDAHLIAGAAGVGAALGADFVKVNPPKETETVSSAERLKEASQAAGRTALVCAGGSTAEVDKFLYQLYDQIHVGGAKGNATGRNIHQRPIDEAIALTDAISTLVFGGYDAAEAMLVYGRQRCLKEAKPGKWVTEPVEGPDPVGTVAV